MARAGGGITKRLQEICVGDGDVHSFAFDDGFLGVYICQNLSKRTL